MLSAWPLRCWHFYLALDKDGLRELDLGVLFVS